MNRTKIEWADYTWNPVTGCKHGCGYCYARRLAEGRLRGRFGYPVDEPFKPVFRPHRLVEPLDVRKPSRIFVCDMGDLFGDWVPSWWIERVLEVVEYSPWHIYLFLTKNPRRYREFSFPPNSWLGTTIEGGQWGRWEDMLLLDGKHVRFVSMEPLLAYDRDDLVYMLETGLDWLIVGAQTNPYRPVKKEWIVDIIRLTRRYGVPLFLKDNLGWPESNRIQEFPKRGGIDVEARWNEKI
jgi:protein gp37